MSLPVGRLLQRLGLLMLVVWALPAGARDTQSWPVVAADGIVPDPRAVWGRLENGLRWVVVPNTTPPGHVSLRLKIEAGSLMETDEQQGLAHFLEHMAFKGSTNLAPGQMVQTLSRLGLAFGPDTNAHTGFDETVYKLELPRNDQGILSTGLDMLAEIGQRLTLPPDQIEPERGVILAERRLRNTPAQRAFEASMRFQFPGSRLIERFPIGQEEVISTAPRQRFEDFYRTWYVPGRSIVAVVGDVDPAVVKGMIEARFRDRAAAPIPTDPDQGRLQPRGLVAHLHTDQGLPAGLTITVQRPWVDQPETLESWRRVTAEQLATTVIDQRLEAIAGKAGAPFSSVNIGTVPWRGLANVSMLRLGITATSWKEALEVAAVEIQRAIRHGVTEEERVQAVAIVREMLQTKAATAATTDSRRLVDDLLYAVGEGVVFTAAETDLRLYDRLAGEIDVAMLGTTLRRLWGEGEPLIELSGPIEMADAEARITAVWAEAAARPVEPPVSVAAASFAYTDFGLPGEVVGRSTLADLGITSLDFANGVALDLKPTTFARDTVTIAVRFGHGRAGLPADRPGIDLLARWTFREGGLGRQDHATLERLFAGKRLEWQLIVGDGAMAMAAETSRQDLEATLQLVTAYLSDPGYRPEAMDGFRRRLDATYRQIDASPQGAVLTTVERLIHGGDPRFGLPPRAEAETLALADLQAWLEPQLRTGPLQVAIVGDIEPEATTALVARTLGALPKRTPAPAVAVDPPRFPASVAPQVFHHDGEADQASVLVYWPTRDGRDQRLDQGLELLADVLQDRLLQVVREQAGATYSPQAEQNGSLAFPGFGFLAVSLDVAADQAAAMQSVVLEVAAGLAREGVSADELLRAQEPRIARTRAGLQNNAYWLYRVLAGMRQFPERIEMARSLERDVQSLDKPLLDELARTYLRPDRALPILVLPRAR